MKKLICILVASFVTFNLLFAGPTNSSNKRAPKPLDPGDLSFYLLNGINENVWFIVEILYKDYNVQKTFTKKYTLGVKPGENGRVTLKDWDNVILRIRTLVHSAQGSYMTGMVFENKGDKPFYYLKPQIRLNTGLQVGWFDFRSHNVTYWGWDVVESCMSALKYKHKQPGYYTSGSPTRIPLYIHTGYAKFTACPVISRSGTIQPGLGGHEAVFLKFDPYHQSVKEVSDLLPPKPQR
jgi:hypothetical protein